jgi:hypothetical protein
LETSEGGIPSACQKAYYLFTIRHVCVWSVTAGATLTSHSGCRHSAIEFSGAPSPGANNEYIDLYIDLHIYLLSHSIVNMIALPRQARDRHRQAALNKSCAVRRAARSLQLETFASVRKTPSFLEFSLCLSRACLGKMIILYINGHAGAEVLSFLGAIACSKKLSICQDRLGSRTGRVGSRRRFCRRLVW